MPDSIKRNLLEVFYAVAPLVAVVFLLQLTVVRAPAALFIQFLIGSLMAGVGMALFLIGVDIGMIPMGRFIGAELPRNRSLLFIAAVAFLLGFATTMAEPDVLVLTVQVDNIARGAVAGDIVMYAMAAGVGVFVSIAMLRIVWGFPLAYLLTASYLIIIVLSLFAPAEFIPLAYDAGSVTTGVLTAPVVISLALGLSSVLAGRSALTDGFGLLGLASIGPIIAILIIAIFLR